MLYVWLFSGIIEESDEEATAAKLADLSIISVVEGVFEAGAADEDEDDDGTARMALFADSCPPKEVWVGE